MSDPYGKLVNLVNELSTSGGATSNAALRARVLLLDQELAVARQEIARYQATIGAGLTEAAKQAYIQQIAALERNQLVAAEEIEKGFGALGEPPQIPTALVVSRVTELTAAITAKIANPQGISACTAELATIKQKISELNTSRGGVSTQAATILDQFTELERTLAAQPQTVAQDLTVDITAAFAALGDLRKSGSVTVDNQIQTIVRGKTAQVQISLLKTAITDEMKHVDEGVQAVLTQVDGSTVVAAHTRKERLEDLKTKVVDCSLVKEKLVSLNKKTDFNLAGNLAEYESYTPAVLVDTLETGINAIQTTLSSQIPAGSSTTQLAQNIQQLVTSKQACETKSQKNGVKATFSSLERNICLQQLGKAKTALDAATRKVAALNGTSPPNQVLETALDTLGQTLQTLRSQTIPPGTASGITSGIAAAFGELGVTSTGATQEDQVQELVAAVKEQKRKFELLETEQTSENLAIDRLFAAFGEKTPTDLAKTSGYTLLDPHKYIEELASLTTAATTALDEAKLQLLLPEFTQSTLAKKVEELAKNVKAKQAAQVSDCDVRVQAKHDAAIAACAVQVQAKEAAALAATAAANATSTALDKAQADLSLPALLKSDQAEKVAEFVTNVKANLAAVRAACAAQPPTDAALVAKVEALRASLGFDVDNAGGPPSAQIDSIQLLVNTLTQGLEQTISEALVQSGRARTAQTKLFVEVSNFVVQSGMFIFEICNFINQAYALWPFKKVAQPPVQPPVEPGAAAKMAQIVAGMAEFARMMPQGGGGGSGDPATQIALAVTKIRDCDTRDQQIALQIANAKEVVQNPQKPLLTPQQGQPALTGQAADVAALARDIQLLAEKSGKCEANSLDVRAQIAEVKSILADANHVLTGSASASQEAQEVSELAKEIKAIKETNAAVIDSFPLSRLPAGGFSSEAHKKSVLEKAIKDLVEDEKRVNDTIVALANPDPGKIAAIAALKQSNPTSSIGVLIEKIEKLLNEVTACETRFTQSNKELEKVYAKVSVQPNSKDRPAAFATKIKELKQQKSDCLKKLNRANADLSVAVAAGLNDLGALVKSDGTAEVNLSSNIATLILKAKAAAQEAKAAVQQAQAAAQEALAAKQAPSQSAGGNPCTVASQKASLLNMKDLAELVDQTNFGFDANWNDMKGKLSAADGDIRLFDVAESWFGRVFRQPKYTRWVLDKVIKQQKFIMVIVREAMELSLAAGVTPDAPGKAAWTELFELVPAEEKQQELKKTDRVIDMFTTNFLKKQHFTKIKEKLLAANAQPAAAQPVAVADPGGELQRKLRATQEDLFKAYQVLHEMALAHRTCDTHAGAMTLTDDEYDDDKAFVNLSDTHLAQAKAWLEAFTSDVGNGNYEYLIEDLGNMEKEQLCSEDNLVHWKTENMQKLNDTFYAIVNTIDLMGSGLLQINEGRYINLLGEIRQVFNPRYGILGSFLKTQPTFEKQFSALLEIAKKIPAIFDLKSMSKFQEKVLNETRAIYFTQKK